MAARLLAAALAASLVVPLWAGAAAAQEASLIFATTDVPNAHLNVRVLHPWAERINQQGKGVVRIDVRDGPTVANHTNFYNRVVDDVVQISWGLNAYLAGKFQRSLVASLPFEAARSEDASVALWRLYAQGAFGSEFDDIQLLYIISFPTTGLHLSKPLKSLDNLNGIKIATGSKMVSSLVTRLGGTPISLPITDYYEGLQRGTVDGVAVQWTAFQPFKLAEVTSWHLDTDFGAGTAGIVFMSKKRYAALPAAARKVIDDNSGEAQSRLFGAFWDTVDNEGRDSVKAMGAKQTIVAPSAEQSEKWRQIAAPVDEEWVKATPDGEALLAKYRAELAKVKAGN